MRDEMERDQGHGEEGASETVDDARVGVEEAAGGEVGNAELSGTETEAEVQELRGELEGLKDRHLRLAAEFDNYRKRNERDRQAMAARLQLDLLSSMLDVLDDLERVANADSGSSGSVVEGVRLVEKKFRSVLEAAGLEPVDAEGRPFDPEVMEALMTVETEDPAEDDRVADVFQRGYRFGDMLVRPARVRVLKYEGGGEEQ